MFWSSFPYFLSWSHSKFLSKKINWFWGTLFVIEIIFFVFLLLSISSKFLPSIFFHPTSFLLIHIWGIIFHAWWSTLVLWFLYLLSYIKNFIFCSIWSICCFYSISFWFQSWGASICQLQFLIQLYQSLFRLGQPYLYQDKKFMKKFILCTNVFLS